MEDTLVWLKSKLNRNFCIEFLKIEILIQNNDKTESIFFLVFDVIYSLNNIGLFHTLESDYSIIYL
jgi:hypothetical protein